jgi:hypothetical protein
MGVGERALPTGRANGWGAVELKGMGYIVFLRGVWLGIRRIRNLMTRHTRLHWPHGRGGGGEAEGWRGLTAAP